MDGTSNLHLPLRPPKQDLIKVDVEGHEVPVLEGAGRVLASRPLMLIKIFDPGSRALSLLREAGYELLAANSLREVVPSDGNYFAIATEQAASLSHIREAHRRCLSAIGMSS